MHKNSYSDKHSSTKVTKALLIIIWVLIFAIAGVGGYMIYGKVKEFNDKSTQSASQSSNLVANVLFIIYDKDNSSVEDEFLLVQFDTVNNDISTVCLPNDVKTTVKTKEDTLDKQYKYGGPLQAKAAVENLLTTKIDRYAEFSCDNIEQIVDSFGGIEYTVEKDLYEQNSSGTIICNLDKGKQTLGGTQTIEYFRYSKWDDSYQTANRRASLVTTMLNQYANEKAAEKITSVFTDIANSLDTDISIMDADTLEKNYSKLLVLKQPATMYEVSGKDGVLDDTVISKIQESLK